MYNFINTSFNESIATPVYWNNSELVIIILIIIMFCQLFQLTLIFWIIVHHIYRDNTGGI